MHCILVETLLALLHGFIIFVLALASYIDIRWKEVPDILNILIALFGLGIRIIGPESLMNGFWGLVVGFGVGLILYQIGFWGGADTKLTAAMGMVIGLNLTFVVYIFWMLLFAIAWTQAYYRWTKTKEKTGAPIFPAFLLSYIIVILPSY